MNRPFADRMEAGRVLAELLAAYSGRSDVIVLALPRGGVPVAFEVASALERAAGCVPGAKARRARVRKSWRWARSPRATSWS